MEGGTHLGVFDGVDEVLVPQGVAAAAARGAEEGGGDAGRRAEAAGERDAESEGWG